MFIEGNKHSGSIHRNHIQLWQFILNCELLKHLFAFFLLSIEPIPTDTELCASPPNIAHATYVKYPSSVKYTCDPGSTFYDGKTTKTWSCDCVSMAPIQQCVCKWFMLKSLDIEDRFYILTDNR